MILYVKLITTFRKKKNRSLPKSLLVYRVAVVDFVIAFVVVVVVVVVVLIVVVDVNVFFNAVDVVRDDDDHHHENLYLYLDNLERSFPVHRKTAELRKLKFSVCISLKIY